MAEQGILFDIQQQENPRLVKMAAIKRVGKLERELKDIRRELLNDLDNKDLPALAYIIRKIVCQHYAITEAALDSFSRKGSLPDARMAECVMLMKYVTTNQDELAHIMSRRSHSTISKIIQDSDDRIGSSPMFKNILEQIDNKIKTHTHA